MEEILIHDIPFKVFLSLFNVEEEVKIIELGDTWHPADGFVNESHFAELRTVGDFLCVDYDFRGLVIFVGQIGYYSINYDGKSYLVRGAKKELEKLKDKLRASGSAGSQ